MTRTILYGLGAYFICNGAIMWTAPLPWYNSVPGVAATGGFNAHFIRDVAIAFAVSGAGLVVAARTDNRPLALFAAGFPVLHAAFHLWIWGLHRGAALDLVAFVNLVGIQLPAWLALIAAGRLGNTEARA
ncbi:hypothetical protein [Shimia aestuarii]|uniref:DoxX-like family protein n=1 Tax=Shimia aestuarii TaxID=254406 RepID=A0A1I4JRV3_9RHOB|nr:hypothetical protein [Shimia aestuarii]SFL69272.1 hypothetical protein SAMN04488042_1011143 [Shimia aestuarii]